MHSAIIEKPTTNTTATLWDLTGRDPMRIKLRSTMVDDQDKALAFYTKILCFQKKHEFPRRRLQVADGCFA